ncbi:hypothetical protein OSTOST_09130 [Ostertagia ostertagi]
MGACDTVPADDEVTDTYLKAINTGITSLSANYRSSVTALAVSKDHNERIYKSNISGNRANELAKMAVFAGKCQLSESQLDAYLRSEVRNEQRRKLLPRRNCSDVKLEDENTPRNDYRIPNFPPQSGSDSEGEGSSVRKSGTNNYQALAEKPQFSLKQVRMICERLLKEQEMRLRYEYELALNQKRDGKFLSKQHDQYVQFASEQMAAQLFIRP